MADVNEIQQRIREGRVELVNQCFQYLCKYYATLKPKAVKALERLRLLSIQRSGGAVSNMPSSGWVPLSLSASTNEEGFLGMFSSILNRCNCCFFCRGGGHTENLER